MRRISLIAAALSSTAIVSAAHGGPLRLHGAVVTPPAYSAGVINALANGNDLRAISDLDTSGAAGIQTGATKQIGVDTLPACASIGTNTGEAYVELSGSSNCTLDGWELANRAIYAHLTGGATATITNNHFKYVSTTGGSSDGINLLVLGYSPGGNFQSGTNQHVVVRHNEFDGTGAYDFHESLISAGEVNTDLTFEDNYVHDFPRDIISWNASGALTVDTNWFKGFARSPSSGVHMEIIHTYQATVHIYNNLMDLRPMASINYSTCSCAFTALVYNADGFDNTYGPTTSTIDHNVVKGAASLAASGYLPAIWELGHTSPVTSVSQTVTANITDKGSSAFVIRNSGTFTDGGGNYEYTSGNPAVLP